MPPIIHLLRHAQGEHNVVPTEESYNKFHDPVLTSLGESQALALRGTFPHVPDLIVVSSLQRTLQTALLGLTKPEIPTLLDPDLQEASGWLCDRGSDVAVLERKFADSKLDFSGIPADWNRKEGPWAPTPEALAKRAVKVRRWLRERPEKQVVVVTHAGFLHWLTQDTVQFDNAEWRTYTFAGDGENDEEARLTQIEKDGEIEKFRI